MRALLLLGALALIGCKRSASSGPTPTASSTAASSASAAASGSASAEPIASAPAASGSAEGTAPAPPDPGAQSVSHQDFIRRTLYLWVTGEQAALIHRDRALVETLRRQKAPRVEASLAAARDPTTLQLLRALKKSDRKPCGLAWSNVWGTAPTSTEPARSKRVVVKATLRPEALVGFYDPAQKRPWRFVDAQGKDVAPGKVMARPEQLGAIYYTLAGDPGPAARGYALVSEEALAAWSIETAEIDAALESAAVSLSALTPEGEPDEAWARRVRDEVWPTSLSGFESTLAVAEASYHPSRAATLATTLRAARGAAHPLIVKPSAAAKPFADLVEKGVQRQVCTQHGDKTICAPQPPSWRRAHDGRFCTDEQGHMRDCPARR